jgi:hypothetical protein
MSDFRSDVDSVAKRVSDLSGRLRNNLEDEPGWLAAANINWLTLEQCFRTLQHLWEHVAKRPNKVVPVRCQCAICGPSPLPKVMSVETPDGSAIVAICDKHATWTLLKILSILESKGVCS